MTDQAFDWHAAFAQIDDRARRAQVMTPEERALAWARGTVASYRIAGVTNRFRVIPDNGPTEYRDLPAYDGMDAACALADEYAQAGMGGAGVRHEGGNVYSFESNDMSYGVARYEFEIIPAPLGGRQ